MKSNPPELRVAIGCGYEAPQANARPWQAPADADVDSWTVCPGYTTTLPETIDIARAWVHWRVGELASYCDGPACIPLVSGCEALAGIVAGFESYSVRERQKRGAG